MEKINRWTIIAEAEKDKWGSKTIKCQCDCGYIAIRNVRDIKSQKSTQCRSCSYKIGRGNIPILKSDLSGKGNNFRHGMYGTATYGSWSGMIGRCAAKTGKDYKWYGSRGITVCDDWLKFDNFFRDMGKKPAKFYLDRINNDLGYFKENCRWVDAKLNSQNRRCVKAML